MPRTTDPFNMKNRLLCCLTVLGFVFYGVLPLAFAQLGGESFSVQSVDEGMIKKTHQSLYADIFDQSVYEEGVQFLRLRDLINHITCKKERAWDVNVYDEVPDSLFFTNRHAKKSLSQEELKEGPSGLAPASGKWTVIRGEVESVNPRFFIRDSAGEEFSIRFDPIDNPELASAAENISSRFFHALGYNVPAYHVVKFRLEDLEVDSKATFYNSDGFRRPLTKQKVRDLLLFVDKMPDDSYRASASASLKGKVKGPFGMDGYRKEDPNDTIPHRYLREIRALQVFASWINYYAILSGNTLDVIEPVNGKEAMRHYVVDYSSTLGSAGDDTKAPHFGHEYIFDFGEFFKSIASLGFWRKPWQKRWDENQRKVTIPSLGYFDNREFDPGKWKGQVPYHAFKDLTSSDGYWAAKQIMAFKDEDVKTVVDAGQLSDASTRETLIKTLVERRDLIGRYWFRRSVPLDWFEVSKDASGIKVEFTDLMIHYGLDASPAQYRYEVFESAFRGESDKPTLLLNNETLSRLTDSFTVSLQVKRGQEKWGKKVCLTFEKKGNDTQLSRIARQI